MTPLRVAIVTRRFWPSVGGPQKLLGNLAAELSDRGCETTVVTAQLHPNWPSAIQIHNVPVVRLPHTAEQGWGNFRYVGRLVHWLRAHRGHFDLVYVSQLKHDACAAVRAVGKWMPVVLRAERAGADGDRQWQREACCGRRMIATCSGAAAIIAPDSDIENELLAAGYARSIVRCIPNGVLEPPPHTSALQRAARATLADSNPELELPEVASLTVYTGRLEPNCGLETLIDAWASITQRWPNARFWLVGEGSLRPALQQHIDGANLRHRAVLVGMFDQVDALLAAADLVVRPTLEAGTGMAILEAMAAGVPTIASDIPGHRTWIADGNEGLLVPPKDATAWAAAIRRMLDDPKFSTQLGGAARRKVADFSLAKMADAHVDLFKSLLPPRE